MSSNPLSSPDGLVVERVIFAPTCWRFIRHIRVHVLYDVISDSSTMETRTTHVVVIINYYFLWYHENVLVLGRTQVAGRQPATTPPRCGAFWSVQFVTARGSCPMPGSATFFSACLVPRLRLNRRLRRVLMMTSKISGPARNPRERTYQRCTRGSCPDALALTTRSSIVSTANADRLRMIHDTTSAYYYGLGWFCHMK
jgi:hypothetical protein